jgi:hypothetical protein
MQIAGRDQAFDEATAKAAGTTDHEDPMRHSPAAAGGQSIKRAISSGVGSRH